jgi:hypothetical protein
LLHLFHGYFVTSFIIASTIGALFPPTFAIAIYSHLLPPSSLVFTCLLSPISTIVVCMLAFVIIAYPCMPAPIIATCSCLLALACFCHRCFFKYLLCFVTYLFALLFTCLSFELTLLVWYFFPSLFVQEVEHKKHNNHLQFSNFF